RAIEPRSLGDIVQAQPAALALQAEGNDEPSDGVIRRTGLHLGPDAFVGLRRDLTGVAELAEPGLIPEPIADRLLTGPIGRQTTRLTRGHRLPPNASRNDANSTAPW